MVKKENKEEIKKNKSEASCTESLRAPDSPCRAPLPEQTAGRQAVTTLKRVRTHANEARGVCSGDFVGHRSRKVTEMVLVRRGDLGTFPCGSTTILNNNLRVCIKMLININLTCHSNNSTPRNLLQGR